jgi:hypothetical protein
VFSANGAAFIGSLGQRPRVAFQKSPALKARLNGPDDFHAESESRFQRSAFGFSAFWALPQASSKTAPSALITHANMSAVSKRRRVAAVQNLSAQLARLKQAREDLN